MAKQKQKTEGKDLITFERIPSPYLFGLDDIKRHSSEKEKA